LIAEFLSETAAALLGTTFFMAGLSKLANSDDFRQAVEGYGLLPTALSRIAAWTIPPVEIFAGSGMLLGISVSKVAALLCLVLAIFTVAIVVNLMRGREISCGCFGPPNMRRISWGDVLRNICLATLALWLAQDAGHISLGGSPILDGGTRLAGLAAGSIIVLIGLAAAEARRLLNLMRQLRPRLS
jgi:uncharacterized membrane protein YphA (DoxX/SURF4 family)